MQQQAKSIGEQIEETLVTFGATRVGDSYEWNGNQYASFSDLKLAIDSADKAVIDACIAVNSERKAKAQAAIEAAKAERAKKALSKGEIAGAAILVCILLFFLAGSRGGGESAESSLISLAHIHCNSYVSDRLVSPSSAEFPMLDFLSNKVGNNHYVIMSSFQAKNRFGVLLKGQYSCNIEWNGNDMGSRNNWKVISLALDNL